MSVTQSWHCQQQQQKMSVDRLKSVQEAQQQLCFALHQPDEVQRRCSNHAVHPAVWSVVKTAVTAASVLPCHAVSHVEDRSLIKLLEAVYVLGPSSVPY